MLRLQKQTAVKVRTAILDTGATHHTLLDKLHVEGYVKLNTNNKITMRTANGEKMKVSFYGSATGLGRIMICEELEEDLISITQLLRNGVGVILS
jgi:predicted aspartyl protease